MKMSARWFVVLYFLSFGLYLYYWYYRTMVDLKDAQDLDISPGWRTAGLFVPILNLFLLYGVFKRLDLAADVAGTEPRHSPGWMLVALIFIPMLLSCFGNQLTTDAAMAANPALVWVSLPLQLIYMIPVAWVFSRILATANGYWGAVRADVPEAAAWNRAEKILVVAGMVLALLGTAASHWFYAWWPAWVAGWSGGAGMY